MKLSINFEETENLLGLYKIEQFKNSAVSNMQSYLNKIVYQNIHYNKYELYERLDYLIRNKTFHTNFSWRNMNHIIDICCTSGILSDLQINKYINEGLIKKNSNSYSLV